MSLSNLPEVQDTLGVKAMGPRLRLQVELHTIQVEFVCRNDLCDYLGCFAESGPSGVQRAPRTPGHGMAILEIWQTHLRCWDLGPDESLSISAPAGPVFVARNRRG